MNSLYTSPISIKFQKISYKWMIINIIGLIFRADLAYEIALTAVITAEVDVTVLAYS